MQLACLLAVMLVSGIAELVSLTAVLPFLAVLSDPSGLFKFQIVGSLSAFLGINSAEDLVIPFTLLFAIASVLSAGIRLLNLWLNARLAAAIGSDLSCEAYKRTLYQPYLVHQQRNSSTVIANATTEIAATVLSLNGLLQLCTSAIVSIGLLIALLVIDLPVALTVAILFGGAYALMAVFSKRRLSTNGNKIVIASDRRLRALQEGLGAIRDVLIDGSQSTYLDVYRSADFSQRQFQAKNQLLGAFPKYVLECLGLIALALLGGVFLRSKGNELSVIPLLGALALGAQRLLPALQQIYSSWSTLKACHTAMESVLGMLKQPMPTSLRKPIPLALKNEIIFKNLSFRYSLNSPLVLDDFNLRISAGERIGLIGITGSGKSTVLDLLMALLEPTSGSLLVDGQNIYKPTQPQRPQDWRASIAHVPQSIYLADCSIAENIAFGVPFELIDIDRVKNAADKAQISKFIESGENGYRALVGERGVRLSGGQRQRIGIARALYKKSTVLVLDEATSALDGETEKSVIEAIDALGKNLTVIMIAHRLSTLANCDRVICLEKGRIISDGPPSNVLPQKL